MLNHECPKCSGGNLSGPVPQYHLISCARYKKEPGSMSSLAGVCNMCRQVVLGWFHTDNNII